MTWFSDHYKLYCFSLSLNSSFHLLWTVLRSLCPKKADESSSNQGSKLVGDHRPSLALQDQRGIHPYISAIVQLVRKNYPRAPKTAHLQSRSYDRGSYFRAPQVLRQSQIDQKDDSSWIYIWCFDLQRYDLQSLQMYLGK